MHIFKKASDIKQFIRNLKAEGHSVGFVPTMGAIHEGHLQLIKRAMSESDEVVVSIFVNPTQFDETSYFSHYPRNTIQDIFLLESIHCPVLFLPSEEEIYPDEILRKRKFDLGYLEKTMEGAHRPGHFQGVAQVISRLLDIIPADRLFLGQKDYQQVKVINRLIHDILNLPLEIVVCPTAREMDGLAISSRNIRLSQEERQAATILYKTLDWAQKASSQLTPKALKNKAMEMLMHVPEISEIGYFEIVNADTLSPVNSWGDSSRIIACLAVRMGEVRLIDNMFIKGIH